ncbi:MAG: hypothetical protein QXL94_00335 [Candidatus Parvarchaeum sp.]
MSALEKDSLTLLETILQPKNHSFKIVRSKFKKSIEDNDAMVEYWYNDGEFNTMRLYNMIVKLGYRKDNHVLVKRFSSKR